MKKINGIIMQYFEWYMECNQNLWNQIKENAEKLSDLGVTAMWLPPAYKGIGGKDDVGYGVYDVYDLGEFNQKGSIKTKYGSKDEYLDAIIALKQAGIESYADIVLNHKMGADALQTIPATKVDWSNHNIETSQRENVKVATKFTFPGRKHKYSDFEWNWTDFDGIDYNNQTGENAIFKFVDKKWGAEVDEEFGNFDYLMGADLDFSNPRVVKECKDWGRWYLDLTKVDGFRLDAVKHIDANFYKEWIQTLRDESKKELFTVGEYWSTDVNRLHRYITETEGKISLFDVPLHFHMFDASRSNGTYDMRNLFKDTLVEADPELAVTFVDNHDTQYGQALESWILDWFKPMAYALILLREKGYPCVFYGDYYGVPNNNLPPVAELPKLMELRKNVAYGEQVDYFDDPSMVGWVRCGDEEHVPSGLVVLMTIGAGGTKKMFVGEEKAGMVYEDVMEKVADTVVIGKDGKIAYTELVPEITQEPDYDKALAAVK